MATATLPEVSPENDFRTENASYAVTGKVEQVKTDKGVEDQVSYGFTTEKAAQKAKEAKNIDDILITQTFESVNVGSEEAFQTLVPSERERIRLINRALDQKFYQIVRQKMLETNDEGELAFKPVEGVVSVRAEMAEEVSARATSPEAKLEKIVDGLPENEAAEMLQKLLARLQNKAS